MSRDSRCRVARGYGSSQIPAAAQGAIQSNQIGGDRRLTLYELIFVCVKIALCIQHRQKIDETCFVLLGREIHSQLAVRYRVVQPVATFLFLRIADQGVLDLFESVENCGLITDQRLPLTRDLYGDVRTYAATSCASLRRISGRLFKRSEGKPTSTFGPAEGIGLTFSSSLRSAPGSSASRTLKR